MSDFPIEPYLEYGFQIMEFDARNHMVIFLCIDYTIWPGWNHRGVYVLSRHTKLQVSITDLYFLKSKVKRPYLEGI